LSERVEILRWSGRGEMAKAAKTVVAETF